MSKWPARAHPLIRILHGSAVAALLVTLSGCVAPAANEEPTDAEYYDSGSEVDVSEAPPPLPDYDQPPCPEDGYIWVPGYWAYQSGDLGGGDFYWVPGAWVLPPQVGVLWTPGYWSYAGGGYSFHTGYWGPHVGFYGGINYGFGYPGEGFNGGAWQGDQYAYNRQVTNVNAALVRSTFSTGVSPLTTTRRVSYNGVGGIVAGPSAREREFAQEHHVGATPAQQHAQKSARNPTQSVHAAGRQPASGQRPAAPPPVVVPKPTPDYFGH